MIRTRSLHKTGMEFVHDKEEEKLICSLSEGPYKWVYATSTVERNARNHRRQSDSCSYNFSHVRFWLGIVGGSLASGQADEAGKGLDLVSLSRWAGAPLKKKTPFAVPNVPCPNIQFDRGSKEFTNPFYPAKPCSPIRSSCIFKG